MSRASCEKTFSMTVLRPIASRGIGPPGKPWDDTVSDFLRLWMERVVEGKVSISDIYTAVNTTADKQSFHPVKQYLDGLTWDGTPRLDSLFIDYLGAENTPYTRAVARKSFTAAVARIMEPGCKFDCMTVLVGKQGLMATNPCDAADVPKGKTREIVPLTDAQIPLFLEAFQGDPYCNAFALCLLAGLREGECLGLSWEQVDFDNGRITISRQLQKEKRKGGQYYIADSTKSGRPRVIEPPPIAFQYLRAEKKKQLENRLHMGEYWDNPFNLVPVPYRTTPCLRLPDGGQE